MLLVTTAINPPSDFTTPRKLIPLISRHFFPVEQPEPCCCTTGLKNGSRFPFIAHFFSSALGLTGSAGFPSAGTAAAIAVTALAVAVFVSLATCLVSDLAGAGFIAGAFATAALGAADGAFFGTGADAIFAVDAGVDFAGAGAVFATSVPPCVCRISANLPAGPDDTS